MYCRNCGNVLNESQAICLKCGVKVGKGDKHCSNCGKEVNSNQEICLSCGYAINKGISKLVKSVKDFIGNK